MSKYRTFDIKINDHLLFYFYLLFCSDVFYYYKTVQSAKKARLNKSKKINRKERDRVYNNNKYKTPNTF